MPSLELTIDGTDSVTYGLEEYAKLDIKGVNVDNVIQLTSKLPVYLYEGGKYNQLINN